MSFFGAEEPFDRPSTMTSKTLTAMITATVLAIAGTQAGATPSRPRSPSTKIIATLKRSRFPLATGGEDCRPLAAHYATLGALVRAHDKLANRERVVTCETETKKAGVLSCSAQFSNRVPAGRSEKEFTLRLEFEMKDQTIAALKCFLAG